MLILILTHMDTATPAQVHIQTCRLQAGGGNFNVLRQDAVSLSGHESDVTLYPD